MASIICPNTSHVNYRLLQRTVKDKLALNLYDHYGRIPDLGEITDYVRNVNGYTLTDDNHPMVWDIEKKEGLIERWREDDQGKRVKVYNKYYKAEANKIAKNINNTYSNATAIVYETESKSTDKRRRYIVRTSIPMNDVYMTTNDRLRFEAEDEYFTRQQEGQYRVDEEGDVLPSYEQRQGDMAPEVREDFEKKKEVMLKAFPFVQEVIEDYSLTVAGLVEAGGNIIRVNPNYWTKDTIGHEFAHILIDSIGGLSNPLVQRGLALLTGSDIWNKVVDAYPDLVEAGDDRIYKEILAQAIGERTVELFDQSQQPVFQRWMDALIRKIKQFFGFKTDDEVTQLARMVVEGKPIITDATIGEYEQRKYKYTYSEEDLKGNKQEAGIKEKPTTIEQIRDKAVTGLKRKLELVSRKKRNLNIERLEYIVKEITKEDSDPVKALAHFQDYTYTQTKVVYAELKKLVDERNEITKQGQPYNVPLKQLARWNDYVHGFTALDDLADFAFKLETYLKESNQIAQFKEVIDPAKIRKTINMRNEIRKFYLEEGKLQVAKFLAPHSRHIEATYKENAERKFNETITREQRKKMSAKELKERREDFIAQYVDLNQEEIRTKTEETIAQELSKASKDVGYMTRWIDNVLDSPDAVVSAMVDAFQDTMFESRLEKNELHKSILPIVQGLEAHVSNMGITGDLRKAYDFMLERDDQGNLTGNIVSKYKSSLWETYNTFKEKLNNTDWTNKKEVQWFVDNGYLNEYDQADLRDSNILDEELIQHALNAWKNKNVPMSKERRKKFEEARDKFIVNMRTSNLIDKVEYQKLMEYVQGKRFFLHNEKGARIGNQTGYPNYKAAKLDRAKLSDPKGVKIINTTIPNIINATAAEEYIIWLRTNTWNYRDVKPMWLNSQYSDLMKLGKSDPKRMFYDFITSKLEEINPTLPTNNRLYTRLPGLVKTTGERLTAEDNTIKSAFRHGIKSQFDVMADEVDRGVEQITDEEGNKINFVPVYYTNDLSRKFKEEFDNMNEAEKAVIINKYSTGYEQMPSAYKEVVSKEQHSKNKWATAQAQVEQSYDLATSYYKFFSSAIDYKHKQEILPEMEMARLLLEQREVTVTTRKGKPILRRGGTEEVEPKQGKESMIYQQLNDWFEAMMYGIKEVDTAKIFNDKVDVGKLANFLNKYTSLNLLGLNVVQGFNNVLLGETMQLVESFGGDYYNTKDLIKARTYYMKNLMGIIDDVGRRYPKHVINLLNKEFDVLNEYDAGIFRENSRFRQMLSSNTLFFTTHIGEHFMQTSVMLAMLDRTEAFDSDGNSLGSMLGLAKVKGDSLVFETEDGKAPANWTNKDKSDFAKRVKRVLSSIHGEYSDEGRVAFQRYASGRLVMMFRKFIVPGFKRRWGQRNINNLLGEYKEGYYVTTGRFLRNIYKDLFALRWHTVSTQWDSLLEKEKSNIRKMLGEVSFMLAAMTLALVLTNLRGEDDDDEWKLSFLTYQALRYRAELFFFLNPAETLRILRSPAASMSVIENLLRFSGNLFEFAYSGLEFSEYERGSWKGQKKITKTMVNFLPGVKQAYRMLYIDDQISFFNMY